MARFSRRRFLGASAALAGTVALTACGDGKRRVAVPSPQASATPSTPVSRGGIFRTYDFTALVPDSFDPHLTRGGPFDDVHSAIFSKLLQYEDEVAGTIVPDLAEAMPEQPDDLTYIFRLRPDARFHDTPLARASAPEAAGRAVAIADIRYNLERQTAAAGLLAPRFYRRSQFEVIDQISERAGALVLTLKRPVAPFLSFLAGRHAAVIPRSIVDVGSGDVARPEMLIGSGPFVLESFEPGVAARLRRNPNWFAAGDKGAGTGLARPYLDGFDAFRSPEEDLFQRAAFDRRLVDATSFTAPEALEQARTTNLADIVLEERDGGGILATRFLTDRAPFRDDRVRRAIHLAVDRHSLIDLAYPAADGRASAQITGPIPPALDRWAIASDDLARRSPFREDRTEAIEEAKRLWAAALGDEPIGNLPLFVTGVPRVASQKVGDAVARQLKDVLGVTVALQSDPSGGAVIAAALRRNAEGATEGVAPFTLAFESGGVDLDDWLQEFHSGDPGNTYRLQDATLDAMLDAQRGEFDEEARRRAGIDIQEYLLANVNARLDYLAPVRRRLAWGYVRNSYWPIWPGSANKLADTWLDGSHPAWRERPA